MPTPINPRLIWSLAANAREAAAAVAMASRRVRIEAAFMQCKLTWAKMTEAVREQISASLAAIAGTFDKERRRILEGLNHSIRRMTAAANVAEWKRAVTDAAKPYAAHSVLWHVGGSGATHAIQAAIESKETVVAACSASEFPPEVLGQLGGASKAYVFPILDHPAVLVAASAGAALETA